MTRLARFLPAAACLAAALAAPAVPAAPLQVPAQAASAAAQPPLPAPSDSAAGAASLPQPTLPRAALLRELLARSPALAEARALQGAAAAQGDALRAGSQEFTAQAQLQQRNVDEPPDNGRYDEWQLLLSRPLRLPSQARADASLAGALGQSSQAALQVARRGLQEQLLQAWFDAQLARADAASALAHAQLLRSQAEAVRKRLALGDASRLEFDQIDAEQARAESAWLLARGRADSLLAALQARWPLLAADPLLRGDPDSASSLRVPRLDDAALRQRLLEHSALMAQARGALRQAQALADQASAARTPQPTLGAYLGSERGGRERIVGLQLQVPFGGAARQARERSALAELDAAQWRLHEVQAQVLQRAEELRVQAAAQADAAHALRLALQRQQLAAARTLRAWSLGEAGIEQWLLAQRNLLDVQRQALQARFDAARSAALLRLQAGLLETGVAAPPAAAR